MPPMTADLPRHLLTGQDAIEADIRNLTNKLHNTLLKNPNAIQTKVKPRRQNEALSNLLSKEVHHLELTGLEEIS